MMRSGSIVCLLASLLAGVSQAAEPPASARPALAENAALKYYQAFVLLPRLTDEHYRALEADGPNAGFDPAVVQVVEQCKDALTYLQRGAALRHCDWGLSYEDGAQTLMPHLQKARELVHVARLRVRYLMARGQHTAAVDDLLAMLALARHVGENGNLISLLVQYAIEVIAVQETAAHLGTLDPAALRRLAERLDQLPRGGSLRTAMKAERDFILPGVKKQLSGPVPGLDRTLQGLVAAFGGPKSSIQQLDELAVHYDAISNLPDLPPGQFREKVEAIWQKAEPNPFTKLIVPAVQKTLEAQERRLAQWALLKAALAVVQGGREQLKNHPDPFGDGPFEYQETPDGFELRSAKRRTPKGMPESVAVKQARKR